MSRKSSPKPTLKESSSAGFKLPFLDKLHETNRSSSAVDLRIKKDGFDGLQADSNGSRSSSPSGKTSSKGAKKYSSSSGDLDKDEIETVGTVSGYGDYLGEELSKMNVSIRVPLSRPKTTDNVISRLPEDGAGLSK
uniref:Uncharacterized protein n=1 Tax=Plectus sambesii TaxID=2011161 RepID=A0A914VRH4_9BILA